MQSVPVHWKRTFFTIWGGQAVSLLTSSIVQYAILWDLTERTGSAAMLSLAALAGFLPTALLGPFIGALVDRWNRKTIMIVADIGIALVTFGLAMVALGGETPVWAVMVALFLRSIGSAFHQPCLQAVTPSIVPTESLTRMNGYTASLQSVSFIASPALAAALFAALPLGPILLLDVLGAVAGVTTTAVSRIPRMESSQQGRPRIAREALDALRMLRGHDGLFWLVVISSFFSIVYVPVASLFPLMSMGYFGQGATGTGIVEMAFAIGMFVGGLVLGVWGGTRDRMVTMVAAIALLGAMTAISGLLPPTGFILFACASFLIGFSGPFFNAPFMAMLQTKIPPEYLGRILGVTASMMSLATPVGLLLSGLFADRVGIQNWFFISGLLAMLCAAPCLLIPSVRHVDKDRALSA